MTLADFVGLTGWLIGGMVVALAIVRYVRDRRDEEWLEWRMREMAARENKVG